MAETTTRIPARDVIEGDVLVTTSADGTRTYRRTVTDVDHVSNIAGRVIIRAGSSTSVVDPDRPIAVER